ncbi:MAG: hypothetical protein VR68_03120 [Peptococcaceae bacterium BRH_c4a]|nr:MAG: hypothetical protein VR68_03120 [Peptococcaceae bacterium BRH_c4a]
MDEIFLERTLNFLLFWGVWLLAPLMFDISTAIVYFISLFFHSYKAKPVPELTFYPMVTIVVPVYNSTGNLYQCLRSILYQSYPVDCIHVICVDNGSQDNSFEVFQRFQAEHHELAVSWAKLDRPGKSRALNAGLYSGKGSYLCNLDSDTTLDKDAIMQVVKTFENDPSLVAATGTIRVDKELGKNFGFIDIVNYCEVIEYLIAFDVGRRYQTLTNTLFTLSGAFSVFRRDIILQSFMYQDRTLAEDTDLTFYIRNAVKNKKARIGSISSAVAFVEPIESLSRLYSQRVRWQRGEIEVASISFSNIPNAFQAVKEFTGRILISDHTQAFSRLTWTFLIPFLYFLGYSLPLVVISMTGLFLCYLLLDAAYFLVAYKSVNKAYRKDLKKIWWIVLFLPVYRYFSYWFRMSGILMALTELKSWQVENPVTQFTRALKSNKFW